MNYISEIMPALLAGTWMTLRVFFWTLVLAMPLGVLVSLGEMSNIKPLKWLVEFYVWIMRGTPLLLQLIFVFYGLPIIGIVFPRYEAALLLLCLTMLPTLQKFFAVDCNQLVKVNLKQRKFYDLVVFKL